MTHWTELPLLSIDFESTGVDPFTVRIVEAGAALINPDGTVANSWAAIVDPGIDIPDEAAAVHGITTERARTEGVAPVDALLDIATMIGAHQLAYAGEAAICAYNCRYDIPLLLTEAERHGVTVPPVAGLVDPLVLDKMHDRYRRGSRKLIDTARHYGVPLDETEAHGALADCIAGGRLAFKLAETFEPLRTRSLASLWLDQVLGYEEGRASFEDYLRRTKDPTAVIAPGWPLPASKAAA